jgi:hypothetical protein
VLLVAALTAGRRDDADPAIPAPTAVRAVPETGTVPLFKGGLTARVVTGLPVAEVRREGGRGGFVLVLDAHSDSSLQAAAPLDVEWGRITVRDPANSEAQRLVKTSVTAGTAR